LDRTIIKLECIAVAVAVAVAIVHVVAGPIQVPQYA
jgi:hypothetical protein